VETAAVSSSSQQQQSAAAVSSSSSQQQQQSAAAVSSSSQQQQSAAAVSSSRVGPGGSRGRAESAAFTSVSSVLSGNFSTVCGQSAQSQLSLHALLN